MQKQKFAPLNSKSDHPIGNIISYQKIWNDLSQARGICCLFDKKQNYKHAPHHPLSRIVWNHRIRKICSAIHNKSLHFQENYIEEFSNKINVLICYIQRHSTIESHFNIK